MAALESRPWNGDLLRTRFFDALSLLLPSGEAFVIRAVSDWLADAPPGGGVDSALRSQAVQFVADEVAHQRAHRLYNERLAQQGLPVRALEARIEAAVARLAPLDLSTRLAMAAAFEQITAWLSAQVLKGSPWLSSRANGREAKLWRWHCAEEVAHAHVAQALAAASGIGRARRAGCLLLAAIYLGTDVARTLAGLLKHDLISRGKFAP